MSEPMTCGGWAGKILGCGMALRTERYGTDPTVDHDTLIRCLDCGTPMCRRCAKEHFAQHLQQVKDRAVELSAIDRFDGDFDLLPLAAHIRYGAVPPYPTSEDFQSFAGTKEHEQRPEAHWHLEAIRWRRANQGKPLNDGLRDIARATATAIIKTLREDWR